MTTQAFQISVIKSQLEELGLDNILSVEEVYRYMQAFGSPQIARLLRQNSFSAARGEAA